MNNLLSGIESVEQVHDVVSGRCLKVIYLHQYFNTPSMPGGSRSYEMARRLVASGHEVHVVTSIRTPGTDRSGWTLTDEEGIQIHWLPVPYHNSMSYRQRLTAFFQFAVQASRKAAELGGDVVFATSTPLTIAIPGIYASRRNKIPMVFEVRDLWPELPIAVGALNNPIMIGLARRLEVFAYRNSARVIALSPGMAEGVVAAGYPRERVSVIPNSCDLDIFGKYPDAEQRFRDQRPELGNGPIVLYAGALGRINGVDYLVELASRFLTRRPDVRFVVIGEGAEEGKVRAQAERLGVKDNNFFLYPRIAKTDIVAAFSAASVATSLFVDLPQMQCNSANKFFDGLASGTAMAINYEGWQADVLRESGAGFVLSRDIDVASWELEQWLCDPLRLETAGQNARRVAEQRFARDRLASLLETELQASVAVARGGETR